MQSMKSYMAPTVFLAYSKHIRRTATNEPTDCRIYLVLTSWRPGNIPDRSHRRSGSTAWRPHNRLPPLKLLAIIDK
jgi:hypothetical protein